MKKTFIIPAVLIAILFSGCAQNNQINTENTPEQETISNETAISTETLSETAQNISETVTNEELSSAAFTDPEDFIKHFYEDYYKNIYLNSFEINLSDYFIQDSGIYNYFDKKFEALMKERKYYGNIDNLSVCVDQIEMSEENGVYRGSAMVTVDYRYVIGKDAAGFAGTSVYEIIENETGYKLSAVNIDLIDDAVLGNEELDSSLYTEDAVKKLEDMYYLNWHELFV